MRKIHGVGIAECKAFRLHVGGCASALIPLDLSLCQQMLPLAPFSLSLLFLAVSITSGDQAALRYEYPCSITLLLSKRTALRFAEKEGGDTGG